MSHAFMRMHLPSKPRATINTTTSGLVVLASQAPVLQTKVRCDFVICKSLPISILQVTFSLPSLPQSPGLSSTLPCCRDVVLASQAPVLQTKVRYGFVICKNLPIYLSCKMHTQWQVCLKARAYHQHYHKRTHCPGLSSPYFSYQSHVWLSICKNRQPCILAINLLIKIYSPIN